MPGFWYGVSINKVNLLATMMKGSLKCLRFYKNEKSFITEFMIFIVKDCIFDSLTNNTAQGCAAPFVEQLLRRAPPKIKSIYYQDTKEKDQKIFSHMACFCHTGVTFEQH